MANQGYSQLSGRGSDTQVELSTDAENLIVPLDELPEEARQVLQQCLGADEVVQYVARV